MARVYFNVVDEADKINNKFYGRNKLVRLDSNGEEIEPCRYKEPIGKDRAFYDIQQAVDLIKRAAICVENMELTKDQRNMISEELINATNFITAYDNGERNGRCKTLDMVRDIQSNKNLSWKPAPCETNCNY